MAEFKVDGISQLMLDLADIAAMPAEVQDEMLNAQADVVVAAQEAKGRQMGVFDPTNTTGKHVVTSIKKTRVKVQRGGVRVIYVYPQGTRTRGRGKKTRNAEIAFVNEYGTRTQAGRPFIRQANEESAKRTTEAAAAVYDRFLQSKNL